MTHLVPVPTVYLVLLSGSQGSTICWGHLSVVDKNVSFPTNIGCNIQDNICNDPQCPPLCLSESHLMLHGAMVFKGNQNNGYITHDKVLLASLSHTHANGLQDLWVYRGLRNGRSQIIQMTGAAELVSTGQHGYLTPRSPEAYQLLDGRHFLKGVCLHHPFWRE